VVPARCSLTISAFTGREKLPANNCCLCAKWQKNMDLYGAYANRFGIGSF
jgi:hypothetical protein